MDRLYTAFVSSTYLDLVDIRALVSRNLLSQDCVPLGMEFFPSTGESQWTSILESIRSADFCVFVVAGRYGSIVPNSTISWTHREFRESVAQGKPIIALLHSDVRGLRVDQSDDDVNKRAMLAEFRREMEETTACRYFSNDTDLVTGLVTSIAALKRDKKIEGWIHAGARPVPVQETDFTFIYELIEIEHQLCFSPNDQPDST